MNSERFEFVNLILDAVKMVSMQTSVIVQLHFTYKTQFFSFFFLDFLCFYDL